MTQSAVAPKFCFRLLIGIVVLVGYCLSACGNGAEPQGSEAEPEPDGSAVADDAYEVPTEYPECRWQEDADIDYAEGAGYPTAHEALNATLDELFYDNFVVIDQTGDTVVWRMNDANGTSAGKVTARKFSSGSWVVERAVFCLPSRIAAKLDPE